MMRKAVCKLLGHRWVFSAITVPRQMFCATCGKRAARGGEHQ